MIPLHAQRGHGSRAIGMPSLAATEARAAAAPSKAVSGCGGSGCMLMGGSYGAGSASGWWRRQLEQLQRASRRADERALQAALRLRANEERCPRQKL